MQISAFHNKRTLGLKRLADLQNEEILPLASSVNLLEGMDLDEALERQWETDAHFVAYSATDGAERMYARINKGAFLPQLEQAGGQVEVSLLVFDHDLPRALEGSKQEWSPESLETFLEVLTEALGDTDLEPTAWYSTLHGSRFIYALTETVHPDVAEALMLGIMAEFATRGIELDAACKDWTRMFRLPSVEREGHGRYESMLIQGGPLLDPGTAPRGEVVRSELTAEVDQYIGEQPTPSDVAGLLETETDTGRRVKTELVKRARIMLQGRESEGIVFEHKPMVRGDSSWNNQVLRVISSVVGMMSEEACTTPEGIYALLHSAIEQLQDAEMRGANETDWYGTCWDLICRMWAREDAKLAARRDEHEAKQAHADVQREEMIEKLREARPQDVPLDPEEAAEWFARRMIGSNGQQHYVMRLDQSYNVNPCADSLLISMIRDLGMEDLIPVTEISGKSLRIKSARDLLADHAMPIIDIEASVRTNIAFIDGQPGYRKLHVPVHALNPNLIARFDQRVADWLDLLGGDMSDRLVEWLSHALDVKRSICALNLYGAPGTGKGMLAQGLAECFESMRPNDHKALGQWNNGLLENPVVNCDEGVPSITGGESLPLDQAFRSLVTGGNVTIRKMRTDPFSAQIFPRIMFTSNDRDIIRSIVGNRDLTDDDTQAIELRLLSIEVTDRAQRMLTSKGNYAYTKGWVTGDKPSELVLANHLFYLYENRTDSVTSSGRLLVEGDISTDLVRDLRLTSEGAETALLSLVQMVQGAAGGMGTTKVVIEGGEVHVTSAGVREHIVLNQPNVKMSLKALSTQLQRFSQSDDGHAVKSTVGGRRGRWYSLDLGVVYEQSLIHGIQADQVRRILCEQVGGTRRAEDAEATYND